MYPFARISATTEKKQAIRHTVKTVSRADALTSGARLVGLVNSRAIGRTVVRVRMISVGCYGDRRAVEGAAVKL